MAKKQKELKKKRPDWDAYFMEIAQMVATRATCNRGTDLKYMSGFKGVGAVITKDRVLLSTGYNGSPRGMPHCDDKGHEMVGGHCIRTIHSEANAIAQAAKNGVAIDGGTLYTTASPCYDCLKLIINSGIKKLVYGQFYDSRYGMSKKVLDLAKKAKLEAVFIGDIKK
ncbi:MAG: cytidine and deoxycytidylate deaminase zinc-binding domain-containing protein [Parcubacteria group bacterium Licking1014_17]|nr:MAG: cytidine and deoxycytidylate deaminase zinc-binding domain-containing protein [Parcubacteria group bacterium Licking1014_17]